MKVRKKPKKGVIKVPNAIDEDSGLRFGIKINLFIFSLLGAIGILMGSFFSLYFLFFKDKSNLLFKLNLLTILIGIASLVYLYWFTGHIKNEKK